MLRTTEYCGMPGENLTIGDAAKVSRISAKMIRYYESIGLLDAPLRGDNGYRVYGAGDLHRLAFIRQARDIGFNLEQIRLLLDLWRDRSRASADVKRIVADQIAALRSRKAEIEAMIATLEHLANACHGDHRPDCPIIETLADHHDAPPARDQGRPARRAR